MIGIMPITTIPRTPDFVKGVINLRGKVIPVIDLRLRMGFESSTSQRTRYMICRLADIFLALVVGYVFYIWGGGNQYGPRYYYEGYFFAVIFVVSKVFDDAGVRGSNGRASLDQYILALHWIQPISAVGRVGWTGPLRSYVAECNVTRSVDLDCIAGGVLDRQAFNRKVVAGRLDALPTCYLSLE